MCYFTHVHIYAFVYTYIRRCMYSPTRATAREHFNPFRGEILTPSVIHFYHTVPRTYSHDRNKYKHTKPRFIKKVNILVSIKSKRNYADLLFAFPAHRKLCETNPMCSPISTAVSANRWKVVGFWQHVFLVALCGLQYLRNNSIFRPGRRN